MHGIELFPTTTGPSLKKFNLPQGGMEPPAHWIASGQTVTRTTRFTQISSIIMSARSIFFLPEGNFVASGTTSLVEEEGNTRKKKIKK